MENQPAAGNSPAAPLIQQNSALIRTDQVQKLPHLGDSQKQTHTALVRGLWDILNSHPPGSNEYNGAHTKLTQVSQNLMRGMRMFQASRQQQLQQLAQQQQQQAQHIQAQAQAVQAQTQAQAQQQQQQQQPQTTQQQTQQTQQGPQQQTQPQSQPQQAQMSRPPTTTTPQAVANPASQARPQMGIPQSFQQLLPQIRAKVDTLTFILPSPRLQRISPDGWMQGGKASDMVSRYRNKSWQARERLPGKVQRTAGEFRVQDQQLAASRQAGQNALCKAKWVRTAVPSTRYYGTRSGYHYSAVVAARAVQAPSQMPGQPCHLPYWVQPTRQSQPPVTRCSKHNHLSAVLVQQSCPRRELPAASPDPQPLKVPHARCLNKAAMAQAAQNNSNAMNQPPATTQPATTHAHPPNYVSSRGDSRNVTMNIQKNLNVPAPEPVSMAPARPTLTSGPSHGATGVMGQPAIQKHPVTGGGDGEGLTPDAEEFLLQMADDFVDDVITAACRLAKLRPSATLDIRDIQLVLERNYNMRIPGFTADDLRTVKKPHPTQGWIQKMSAVQAAKVTQGRAD
ncbi:transcription initiation factor TFIID subunit 12 [Coccidioides immitis RMSCC 3703]|uniref:Transcription initiation factor TFIID subunit 12 n=1 Tax=Coccidioides immitis RMSCC 3703 TaxID=454286 RepID=A0A0J8QZL2_COCIT|nr:transcription initiation factor TFIID subunit 12 [Coccidioides immitis RMSCC 3703]